MSKQPPAKTLDDVVNYVRQQIENLRRQLEDLEDWIDASLGPQLAELGKLPWKPYKEGHRAAWIFADTKGAEQLAEMIRHSEEGKVEIAEFTYRFSGPKENPTMFISRNPTETKEASS